jgi:hypothetical protein
MTLGRGRSSIARLAVADKVFAITRVVITKKAELFAWMRICQNVSSKKGDIILTYTYHAEGDSEAPRVGIYPNFDIRFSKSADGFSYVYVDPGKKEWWAKVRLKSGRTGWVDMYRYKFNNVDRYG